MRPYGEVTGKTGPRVALCGSDKPHRYRRVKRKAELAAEKRAPRKAERRRAKTEIEHEVDHGCYASKTKPCTGYLGSGCRNCGRIITLDLLERGDAVCS